MPVLYTAPELLLAAQQKITTIRTNWKSQFLGFISHLLIVVYYLFCNCYFL